MILHTTEVTPLPGYRLCLRFNNGAAGEVGLSAELLRAPAMFATASQHPVMRTAAWENGADLAPEYLLDLMRAQRHRIHRGLAVLEYRDCGLKNIWLAKAGAASTDTASTDRLMAVGVKVGKPPRPGESWQECRTRLLQTRPPESCIWD